MRGEERDRQRARARVCVCAMRVGPSCYRGTEHVADKRAMLFKEKGRPVKCAPIRHHRLTVP